MPCEMTEKIEAKTLKETKNEQRMRRNRGRCKWKKREEERGGSEKKGEEKRGQEMIKERERVKEDVSGIGMVSLG